MENTQPEKPEDHLPEWVNFESNRTGGMDITIEGHAAMAALWDCEDEDLVWFFRFVLLRATCSLPWVAAQRLAVNPDNALTEQQTMSAMCELNRLLANMNGGGEQ